MRAVSLPASTTETRRDSSVMRLLNTIRLFGGGPGSGCNPDAGKCGRPAGSGAHASKEHVKGYFDNAKAERWKGKDLPPVVDKAIDLIVSRNISTKLFDNRKLLSFNILGREDYRTQQDAGGFYTPSARELYISAKTPGVLIHELGHHFDYEFGSNATKQYAGEKISLDKEPLGQASHEMYSEFREGVRKLREAFGGKMPTDKGGWQSPFQINKTTANGVRIKCPSTYALLNPQEWFAESFKAYITNPESLAHLPKTQSFMKRFVAGEFITEGDKA